MTLRLVALMSVVLLLCLGAFGLIANHYHQQVMEEAAKIASESAKAIFGSLDASHDGNFFQVNRMRRPDGWAWQPAPGSGAPSEPQTRSWDQAQLVIVGDVDPAEARKLIEEMTERRFSPPIEVDAGARLELQDVSEKRAVRLSAVGGQFVTVECRGDGIKPEQCALVQNELDEGGPNRVFVSIENIHASTGDEGLMLTIPTFMPEPPAGETGSALEAGHREGDDIDLVRLDSGDNSIEAKVSEIHLPISVRDYKGLFDRMRMQSLFLFFGVFLVGIALSAGAAARFTRPARRLDAALRELSDGDLETEVEVHGNDEMARLGLAFNEMARKLRANRERAREMVRRDKLSALGRLAAGVAHDVRNPLHSIGLTLSHLDDTGRPVNPERAAEFDRSVTMIRGEIRRLDQLVVNFLRFANGDHRERKTVDLKALVEDTARLIRKEAQWRGIELVLDLEDVPEVLVDVEAIRSSLLNLVLNSCEAMPKGGRLDIVLRDEHGEVALEVGDTGRGIPADQHEKVFDFGYSTREGGSGLGLVMVHQCVVEDHHGHVTLESEEGHGTRVRIVLPVNPDSPAETPTDGLEQQR